MLRELEDLKNKQMPFILHENKLRKDKAAAEKDNCFLERQLEDIGKKKHKLYCIVEYYPIHRTNYAN